MAYRDVPGGQGELEEKEFAGPQLPTEVRLLTLLLPLQVKAQGSGSLGGLAQGPTPWG